MALPRHRILGPSRESHLGTASSSLFQARNPRQGHAAATLLLGYLAGEQIVRRAQVQQEDEVGPLVAAMSMEAASERQAVVARAIDLRLAEEAMDTPLLRGRLSLLLDRELCKGDPAFPLLRAVEEGMMVSNKKYYSVLATNS